jgi:hypothetical protein
MKARSARLPIAAALVLCGTAAAVGMAGTVSASTAAGRHPPAHAVTAAAATKVPVVLTCLKHGQVRPRQYILTCADANDYLTALRWAGWGPAAFASGTNTFNDCVPTCVAGHLHSFPVLVTLWRAEPLPGHPGQRYFARLTLIYTGNRSYRAGGQVHHLPVTSTGSLSASGGL